MKEERITKAAVLEGIRRLIPVCKKHGLKKLEEDLLRLKKDIERRKMREVKHQ